MAHICRREQVLDISTASVRQEVREGERNEEPDGRARLNQNNLAEQRERVLEVRVGYVTLSSKLQNGICARAQRDSCDHKGCREEP